MSSALHEEVRLFQTVSELLRERTGEATDGFREIARIEATPGCSVPASDLELSSAVRTALEKRGYEPWTHQAEAIRHIQAGRNVVLTTRTASGKSLVYGIPIAEMLLESPDETALLCFPQRALANDQLQSLRSFLEDVLEAAGRECPEHLIARYDGSTPKEDRQAIRSRARVVLTNPEMLHLSMLAHASKWERFHRGLRYLVIDEAHDYRGVFGANLAMCLQRLRLSSRRQGRQPQFIACSATIHDPVGHLRLLTGLEFSLVSPDSDGSAQGERRFWCLETSEHPFEAARHLMREMVRSGLRVLCFCNSRRGAEELTRDVQRSLEMQERVAVYRAGLSREDRARIEEGLKSGDIRGVFSTNALELGIDIGELDVCLCVGFPNTLMSLWQRAGRVGRQGNPGAVVIIPDDRPLDTYYADHPDVLFQGDTEPLAINLNSRTLAKWHYACAYLEADRNMDLLDPTELEEPLRTMALEHRYECSR
ncbi:MAG: DEAD/DEAH box helicase [Planctomycetota bacterium]